MGKDTDRLQDEISILEYRSGDLDALVRLLSRWQVKLHAYLVTMLRNEHDAWDVSQETWLAVISGLNRRRGVRHFAGWLYTIARNKCFALLRKRRELPTDGTELENEPAGDEAVDIVITSEGARALAECIDELPLPQREALVLYHVDGLAVSEIAQVQGAPVGTVQTRLFHARKKLKEMLTRKGYGNDKR